MNLSRARLCLDCRSGMTRLDAMRQLLGLTSTVGEIKSPRQIFGRDAAKLALPQKPIKRVRAKKVKPNVTSFRKRA